MITQEQEKWLEHLSDTDQVKIVPFDPTAAEKFESVKKLIQERLGEKYLPEHHGATALGISGQDEIDVYVPVTEQMFDFSISEFTSVFGKPKSFYALRRARFTTMIEGKRIDIFVMNKESSDWSDLQKFENYWLAHPENLEKYRILKENGSGLSSREYYRRKLAFLNQIPS